MKPRVYIDTSAYLGILLEQPSGNKHKKQSDSWTLCSSTLLILESERNLVRFSREKKISEKACQRAMEQLKADVDTLILRDFMLELCLTGTFPAILTPRSLDLIHLRTAIWFAANGGLEKFITLDEKQAAAARELGLPV